MVLSKCQIWELLTFEVDVLFFSFENKNDIQFLVMGKLPFGDEQLNQLSLHLSQFSKFGLKLDFCTVNIEPRDYIY